MHAKLYWGNATSKPNLQKTVAKRLNFNNELKEKRNGKPIDLKTYQPITICELYLDPDLKCYRKKREKTPTVIETI